MMIIKESVTNKTELLIAAMLACFYIGIALYLQSSGWFSSEGLFFSEKAQLWASGENSTIKINLFTYPLVGFLCTLPFLLVDSLSSPFIASSLGMAFIAYCLLLFLRKEKASLLLRIFVLSVFVIHPTCLYIAVSGSPAYLTILVALFYYIGLFKYLTKATTYYLALSSFLLSMMTFVDYKMIWLGCFALPVFVIACFKNSPSVGGYTFTQKLQSLWDDDEIRQAYLSNLFSRLFLFYLLPVIVFVAYLLLNDLYTNNPLYFTESLYANYLAREGLKGSNTLFASPDVINESLWVEMAKVGRGYIPLISLALYLIRKDISSLIILGSTWLIILLQLIVYPYIPQGELFLILVFVGMLTIQYSIVILPQSRHSIQIVFALSMLCMFSFSWYNLYNSKISPEKNMVFALVYNEKESTFKAEKQMADFILHQVPAGEKVLTDDAVSYPIVAFTQNASKFMLPYNPLYNKVIQDPAGNVGYVLVSKKENMLNLTDKLSLQFNVFLQTEGSRYLPVFSSGNWILYRTDRVQRIGF